MPGKSVFKRGFKANAERLAEQYRKELNISIFHPLDAFKLAEHLQVPVFSVQDLQEMSPKHLETLSDPTKFSALWLPNEEGQKIIIHNSTHSLKRQQSNLMHELAHVILNHEIPEEEARLCKQFGLHYYNEEHEQEAKYLGASLQITRPGLLWSLKKNMTEEEISDYYNASTDMVKFRLNTSGVLIQYRNKSR